MDPNGQSYGTTPLTYYFRQQAIGCRFALIEAKQQNPSQLVRSPKP
jgi:hypothetical protein